MSTKIRNQHLVVILLYTGLTLLFLNPLSLHLAGSLTDAVDPLLSTWIAAWDVQALSTDPAQLFDANIFTGYTGALAYSETLLGSVLLMFPAALASGLPVLTHNGILLLGFVLGGYHAYLLGRAVTRSHLAAFLVGVIFVFNVYRLSMVPKVQMSTLQWLPLAFYYLWRVSRWGRRRDAVLLALFLLLQVLTTVYYGVFTALMLVLLTPLFLWAYRTRINADERESKQKNPRPSAFMRVPKPLASLALAALLAASVVIPYALPYLRLSRTLGLERTLADAVPFAASLRQWALVGADNLLHGRWLALPDPPMVGPYPVDFLFPGLLALMLAAASIFFVRRGHRLWFAAALLLVGSSFVLSLGPELMVEPLQTLGIRLPYAWLHEHLPGFAALRAPARFAGFFMLGLGLLAGTTLAGLQKMGVKPLLLAGLTALVFLESLSWPATTAMPVPQGRDIPPVYAWLAEQPPGGVVELPAALPQQRRLPERWLWPQYFSIYHWRPTPSGYSGFVPPRHETLIDLLNRFPDPAVLPLYRALDVRYVLIHRRYFDDLDLLPLWEDETVAVVEVGGAEPPALITGAGLFLLPTTVPGSTFAPLLTLDLAPTTRAFPPGSLARGSVEWRQEGRLQHRADFATPLPFLVAGRTALNLPASAPPAPGDYDVTVRVSEPVEIEATGRVSVQDAVPALQALPLTLQAAAITCTAAAINVQLTWSALGWIDTPQSVFLHLLDAEGNKIAQLDTGLEPPPAAWLPRTPVFTTHQLPAPDPATPPATLRLGLYAWSDRFQTIIPAHFFGPDLQWTDAVALELTDPACLR